MTGKKDANQTAELTGDIYPDSWERFERAVDAAVKSGPKHKVGKKAKVNTKAIGLARKAEKDS